VGRVDIIFKAPDRIYSITIFTIGVYKMNSAVVTYKNNVQCDEDGRLVLDENEEPILNDYSIIGIMLKTHCIQVSQINPESNMLETGVIFKVEVLWEHKRSPSPALEDPADLAWLTFGDDDDDDDDPGAEEEVEESGDSEELLVA
jgi:hypothetical protein